jgi:hypothetical protein
MFIHRCSTLYCNMYIQIHVQQKCLEIIGGKNKRRLNKMMSKTGFGESLRVWSCVQYRPAGHLNLLNKHANKARFRLIFFLSEFWCVFTASVVFRHGGHASLVWLV